jgi:alpha-D-ribose 1-methylphosphonate 5-triphosphate synthase subunit PhnH
VIPGAGFHEPPLAAQGHFRTLLDAMAHPGRVVPLVAEQPEPPLPMQGAAFAVALTLLDHETPVWLGPSLHVPAVADGLRFHCGCPITADPATAALAFAVPEEVGRLDRFAQGTADYPDRSTTLVLQVRALAGEGPRAMRLTGPGIETAHMLFVPDLPDQLWAELAANADLYPLGVDLVLVAGGLIAALPRSTRVKRT